MAGIQKGERVIGYSCKPEGPGLVTLYAGKFRSALRGAAYEPGQFVINTRGAKKGGGMKVLLFGEARKDPEKALSILENSLAGSGNVPRPEFEPVYEEVDLQKLVEDLEEQLGFAQEEVEEAGRRVEVADRERDRAYNLNMETAQARERLAREREELSRKVKEAEEQRRASEERWGGAVRDNKALRAEARIAREERDRAIEERDRALLEQTKTPRDPAELLISAVRNYSPTMATLDVYEKELNEALGGNSIEAVLEIAEKTEADYVSEKLKDVGVKPEDVPAESLPEWEQSNYYKSNFEKYNRAVKNKKIITAGLAGGEELTEDLKPIVESADKIISEFELERQTYQRKASAVSTVKEARETYRCARKAAEKIAAAPTVEIPIAVIGDVSAREIRIYFPQSEGEFSESLFKNARDAGLRGIAGYAVKAEGGVRIASAKIDESGSIDISVASVAKGLRDLKLPEHLKGRAKVSVVTQ